MYGSHVNERLRKVLHDIIDGLGGGHQHLHAALDDASPVTETAPTPGAEQTGNEDASGDPKPAGK